MALITLAQATDHLRFTVASGSDRERELLLKMAHAEAIVLDYINTTEIWREQSATWTDELTVPPVVQAAILLQLAELMRFRGDDVEDQGAAPGEGFLAPHIKNLLMRSRDPVIA